MQAKQIESYFLAVIRKERTGIIAALLRFFLLLFSWVYKLIALSRNWAYDHGWFRRYCPPVPLVISVGNIVVGGTGKTPVTMMLAKEFYGGFPLAILSRGYRSQAEKLSQPVCLCNGKGVLYPPSFCGDEPYLLAKNLPHAYIFVGRNRHKSSIMAAKAGVKVILLDDGMQHRQLSRDLDIVVMDIKDLFGQGYYLPRGFMREGPDSLARAHLVLLNHVESHEQFVAAKDEVAKYTHAPVVGTRLIVRDVIDFKGDKIESLLNKKVGVFCGIARPEYFVQTIEAEGATVVGEYFVSDHRDFDHVRLEIFAKQCLEQGAELLICTEKDRVKFTEPLLVSLPLAWLQIELSIVEEGEAWTTFINKAKNDVIRRM